MECVNDRRRRSWDHQFACRMVMGSEKATQLISSPIHRSSRNPCLSVAQACLAGTYEGGGVLLCSLVRQRRTDRMLLRAVPICPFFHATRDNAFSNVVRRPCRSPPCRSRIPVAPERTMPGDGKDPERDWKTRRSFSARFHPRQDSRCN